MTTSWHLNLVAKFNFVSTSSTRLTYSCNICGERYFWLMIPRPIKHRALKGRKKILMKAKRVCLQYLTSTILIIRWGCSSGVEYLTIPITNLGTSSAMGNDVDSTPHFLFILEWIPCQQQVCSRSDPALCPWPSSVPSQWVLLVHRLNSMALVHMAKHRRCSSERADYLSREEENFPSWPFLSQDPTQPLCCP